MRAPHQLYLVSEVFKVRIKSSFTFFEEKRLSSRLPPLFCVKWRVFLKQAFILTKFNCPGTLKVVAGFKKQTELYPYKCRGKVQPHQPKVLIVLPTQMLKNLRFV